LNGSPPADPDGSTRSVVKKEKRQRSTSRDGLGRWPVPSAKRRRLRFPSQNQRCQRAGSADHPAG